MIFRRFLSSTRFASAKKGEMPRKAFLGRQSNKLTAGVVGLANVGKSTFFQAITRTQLGNPANFPFATIDTEHSQAMVKSPVLDHYMKLYQSQKKLPSALDIYDIAGLTRGASTGKGMGNKFLSEIRLVDGIFHMVRGFVDDEIVHIEDNKVDPLRDIEIVNDELIMKDLEYIESAVEQAEKLLKKPNSNVSKLQLSIDTLMKAQDFLYEAQKVSSIEWTDEEIEVLNTVNLLTAKPMVYLLNVNERDYESGTNAYKEDIEEWIRHNCPGDQLLMFSASLETRIAAGEVDESCSCLGDVVQTMRTSLNLISFYTCGPKEARQWTVRRNTIVPDAAGVIHTDLKNSFITAQVYKYKDLQAEEAPLDESKLRANGRQLRVGKSYIVEDGDVLLIKSAKGNTR